MTCTTCHGYGFVEVEGQKLKALCPDCTSAASYAAERVRRIRSNVKAVNVRPPANRAPVSFVRCPVHKTKVGLDGDRRLLGRCDGCASDYAKALRWLRAHPYAKAVA